LVILIFIAAKGMLKWVGKFKSIPPLDTGIKTKECSSKPETKPDIIAPDLFKSLNLSYQVQILE
jgi:hypothetical protein